MQGELPDSLARLEAALPRMAERAMAFAMLRAEQIAKATTAYQDQTGNLRNSTQAGVTKATEADVEGALSAGYPGFGASMEYARRIELGFVGEDSLERTYNQAPRPYIRPSMDQVTAERVFERAMEAEMQAFFGRS